jgi:tetratricopeptide (TPR) repeat protein
MLDRAAYHAIRMGDFAAADRLFRTGLQAGNALTQRNALWAQIISLRYQGQMSSAVEVARRFRAAETVSAARPLGAASPEARPLGAALDDAGRHREAAAVFDSIAKWRAPDEGDSWAGRDRAWSLTHAAYALAAAGDTARLGALADTIAAQGAKSASGRDQRLHYYVRGLLLVARNDLPAAESAFRNAIWSTTIGYTRANADLARVLLRLGKPREAVAVLQPALRGKLDASNYYVTHTELHDLLGRAWDAVGVPDSAAAHLELVARAWANGDPPFRQRAAVASARVRALR